MGHTPLQLMRLYPMLSGYTNVPWSIETRKMLGEGPDELKIRLEDLDPAWKTRGDY